LNFAFLPFVKASSQQYLPFTVLKLNSIVLLFLS